MDMDMYDVYRKLGYTIEETWNLLIAATETDDGIADEEV